VEYVLEAEKKHQEEIVKDKKIKERMNRVNFRNFIKRLLCSAEISYKTKWRVFVKEYKNS